MTTEKARERIPAFTNAVVAVQSVCVHLKGLPHIGNAKLPTTLGRAIHFSQDPCHPDIVKLTVALGGQAQEVIAAANALRRFAESASRLYALAEAVDGKYTPKSGGQA